MVYVSQDGAVSSDGRTRDLHGRPDIAAAVAGEAGFYGHYFDEEEKFVVCYTAPVYRAGEIAGVLTVEKDGYYFSSLIENVRLVDSGEAYSKEHYVTAGGSPPNTSNSRLSLAVLTYILKSTEGSGGPTQPHSSV